MIFVVYRPAGCVLPPRPVQLAPSDLEPNGRVNHMDFIHVEDEWNSPPGIWRGASLSSIFCTHAVKPLNFAVI